MAHLAPLTPPQYDTALYPPHLLPQALGANCALRSTASACGAAGATQFFPHTVILTLAQCFPHTVIVTLAAVGGASFGAITQVTTGGE